MGTSVFEKQDIEKVEALRINIEIAFQDFLTNSFKSTNKSGARKARNNTIALEKLMKEYRKISIKSNQTKEE